MILSCWPYAKNPRLLPRVFVAPSGLLIAIDFQLFAKIVDHFVDLEPKNWAILSAFYVGEFDFTKVVNAEVRTN